MTERESRLRFDRYWPLTAESIDGYCKLIHAEAYLQKTYSKGSEILEALIYARTA